MHVLIVHRNMLIWMFSGLLLVLATSKNAYAFNTVAFNSPRSAGCSNESLDYFLESTSKRGYGRLNRKNKQEKTNGVSLTRRVTFLQASSSQDEESTSTMATATIDKSEGSADSSREDFDTMLQTRRTINNFLPDLPNNWEQTLQQAIQSAIHAPNHKRTEPWRFHLLGPVTIRQVCELNASIVAEKKGEKAGEKKLERWLQMPGWVVVTCQTADSSGSMKKPSSVEREDYAACCCAVQNLCLSLHNAGMGTKWGTGSVNFDSRFEKIVGLAEGEYVVGTIWFGTPEKAAPDAPAKKRSMEDVFIKHE